jgi:hypothetical protein
MALPSALGGNPWDPSTHRPSRVVSDRQYVEDRDRLT